MIRPKVPAEMRADFGPVTLIFADRGMLVEDSRRLAMMQFESFATNLDALHSAVSRIGRPDFNQPWISSEPDRKHLWHETQIAQFARDPLVFAAEVAGILEGDLARGPVELHGDPQPGKDTSYPTFRNAIMAALNAPHPPSCFIMAPAETVSTVLPESLKLVLEYLSR